MRKQPNEKKIKFLWLAVAISGIIIIAIWILTLNIRTTNSTESKKYGEFKNIWDNVKQINLNPKS